jgi:hypothetical protein
MAWRSPHRLKQAVGLALAVALATVATAIVGACPAQAAANGVNQARLDNTVKFLQEVQNTDGGFGGVRGGESDPAFSAWVALALAAAGINPQDQTATRGGVDAYAYISHHAGELSVTTDFERVLLVADASGTSPRDFGGSDLVQIILDRQLHDGSFAHVPAGQPGVNDTIFGILALSLVHEPGIGEAVRRAADWLEGEQNDDGSWSSNCIRTTVGCNPEAEVDMTAASIEALTAAGRRGTESETRSFAFLRAAQNADGGFSEKPVQTESNVASTAWAAQGIWAGGQSPEDWTKGGVNPLGYMASLQQLDGSIRFKVSEDSIPVWMTAYVAPAFAGQPLPIPAVPRRKPETPSSASSIATSTPAPAAVEAGDGGQSGHSGGGVIAGGGGNGAPLFSRPKPQSRGKTPGGARQLSDSEAHVAANRGLVAISAAQASASGHAHPASEDAPGSKASTQIAGASGVVAGSNAPEVSGVLVGAAKASAVATLSGAPGLRSARIGGDHAPWVSIAIGAAIALLIAGGALLERRRPQMVL